MRISIPVLMVAVAFIVLPMGSTASGAFLQIGGLVTRLDADTFHFEVNGMVVIGNPYDEFNISPISPYGDHVWLDVFATWGYLSGEFGTFNESLDLYPGGGTFYSGISHGFDLGFDAILPPRSSRLIADLWVNQEWMYEYPTPPFGLPRRDLVGVICEGAFFADLPTSIGATSEINVTPEPSTLAYGGFLLAGLLTDKALRRRRRRPGLG